MAGYLSDNLKYFPDKPKCVKFWRMKKEFSLALFVVIKNYSPEITEKIKELQNEIKNQLPKDTNFLYDIDKIEKEGLEENGLYVYPSQDFHFTLINFLKYNVGFEYMSRVDSEELRNLVVGYKDYDKMKSKIEEVIEKFKPHKVKLVDLRWIYSGDEKGIESISLQAFPGQKFIDQLKEIENKTKEYTNKLPWPNLKVKAHPEHCPVAFTMNILRFIENTKKDKSKSPKKYEKLIDYVEKINKRHNKEPLYPIDIKEIALYETNDAFFHKHKRLKSFNLR